MTSGFFEKFLELGFVEGGVVGVQGAGGWAAGFDDGFVEERGGCVDVHDVMANLGRLH